MNDITARVSSQRPRSVTKNMVRENWPRADTSSGSSCRIMACGLSPGDIPRKGVGLMRDVGEILTVSIGRPGHDVSRADARGGKR